jgi:hypothetical protein
MTVPHPEVQNLLAATKRNGMEAHFLDITTALGIPAIACVIARYEKHGKIRLGMGAASGSSSAKLFLHSLIEANSVANGLNAKEDKSKDEKVSLGPFRDRSLNREKRLAHWQAGYPEKETLWFLTGKSVTYEAFAALYGVQDFKSMRDELAMLKGKFRTWIGEYGEGYHPYVYYPKQNKLISQFGFRVASVVVPSLYPIYLQEHAATLDISSLWHWHETLKRLGFKERALEVVNTTPHPFP